MRFAVVLALLALVACSDRERGEWHSAGRSLNTPGSATMPFYTAPMR
jgi:hypothetical protein